MELIRVLSILPVLIGIVNCCSPEHYVDPTMPNLVYYADVVLTGSVVRTFPDPHLDSAYTIEVKVSCIYKKKDFDVPALVNISEAGFVAGMCHASDFQVGNNYIIFTRSESEGDGDVTLVINEAQRNMTEDELKDLSTVCGIELMTLQQDGDAADSQPACPSPVKENCQTYDPKVEEPPPPPVGSINPAGVSGRKDAGAFVTSSVIMLLVCLIISL